MANKDKEKEHEKLHKIYKAGDKYHCGECGAEVHWDKDCPECKLKIDWTKVEILSRRM